jgi:hypothetical protein
VRSRYRQCGRPGFLYFPDGLPTRGLPKKPDDRPHTPTPHLTVVSKPPEPSGAELAKQDRLIYLLLHLDYCRSFIDAYDAYEGASESLSQLLPKLTDAAKRAGRDSWNQILWQVLCAENIDGAVQTRMEKLAEFQGDLRRFAGLAQIEARFFRRKARTLAKIVRRISDEMKLVDNKARPKRAGKTRSR